MIWSASHSPPTVMYFAQDKQLQHAHADPCQRKRKVFAQQIVVQNDHSERKLVSIKHPSVVPPPKTSLSREPGMDAPEGAPPTFSSTVDTSLSSEHTTDILPQGSLANTATSTTEKNSQQTLDTFNGDVQSDLARSSLRQRPTLILQPTNKIAAKETPKLNQQRNSAETLSPCEVEVILGSIQENAIKSNLKPALESLESLPIEIHIGSALHSLLLKQCGQAKSLPCGKRVHEHIRKQGLQHGTFLGNYLMNMYRLCGDLSSAVSAFDDIHWKNKISWTIIISAYAQIGQYDMALQLFRKMQKANVLPDKVTLSTIIGACSSTFALEKGREIHQIILDGKVESDIVVESALVNMYVKCGSLEEARKVFDSMQVRNVVSWTTMITAYAKHNQQVVALQLFQEMILSGHAPNEFTLVGALSACSSLRSLASGQHIHAVAVDHGCDSNVAVGNALIYMYGKCGDWGLGLKMFRKMPEKDVISWTSMLGAYEEHGRTKDTLQLFEEMQWEGIIPDKVTFLSILGACADLSALQQGKRIHSSIIARKLHMDQKVGCALIHMYGKCGSVESAREAFDNIQDKNVHTWTAMIGVYTQHGFARNALASFSQMLKDDVKPNEITFVSVLSACCYGGFVAEAWRCFDSISREFGITPTAEHYACMVDTLGRAGFLKDAEELIKKMPVEEDIVVWRSMLIACSAHNDVERSKWAAEKCVQLEPSYGSPYVILSNIHAAAEEWGEVARIKGLMERNGAKKQPGKSSIEIKEKVHEFVVDDQAHPQINDVRSELDILNEQLEMAGYVPSPNSVLHDVEEELTQDLLKYHSERLAIVFGHIMTPPKSTICIIKNLRVCTDCHCALKHISKILGRELIVRDPYRIHRFKEGKCSCLDYW